jgi:hypothetical protein
LFGGGGGVVVAVVVVVVAVFVVAVVVLLLLLLWLLLLLLMLLLLLRFSLAPHTVTQGSMHQMLIKAGHFTFCDDKHLSVYVRHTCCSYVGITYLCPPWCLDSRYLFVRV